MEDNIPTEVEELVLKVNEHITKWNDFIKSQPEYHQMIKDTEELLLPCGYSLSIDLHMSLEATNKKTIRSLN